MQFKFSNILFTMLIAVVCVLCNLQYRYESFLATTRDRVYDFDEYYLPQKPVISQAGWPLKYRLQLDHYDRDAFVTSSWRELGSNVAFFLGIAAVANGYIFWRRRRSTRSKAAATNVQVPDVLLLIAVVAFGFSLYRQLHSQRQKELKLAAQIQRANGSVTMSCLMPKWFASYLPDEAKKLWQRIEEVILFYPDDRLLKEVMALRKIRSLNLGGDSYDLRLLDEIPEQSLLYRLRVSGRELDPTFIGYLSQARQLRSLNLMRTNITADGLMALGDLDQMVSLTLNDTDIKLADMKATPLLHSVEELQLPHPPQGMSDECTLDGLHRLSQLTCAEHDEYTNAAPVTLRLRNLPELDTVMLDTLQRFNLELENLPKLTALGLHMSQALDRVKRSEPIRARLWIDRLKIRGPQQLKTLILYPEIGSLDIRDTALETLAIEPRCLTYGTHEIEYYYRDAEDSEQASRQNLLQQISQVHGCKNLLISNMSIGDHDFSEFAKHASYEAIKFTDSALLPEQFMQLAELPTLKTLTHPEVLIDGSALEKFVKQSSQIERIEVALTGVRRLRIEHSPTLVSVLGEPSPVHGIEALRLVDMPKFEDSLVIGGRMIYFHVEKLPKLRTLVFASPPPDNAVLSDVSSLETFVAGGTSMSDALLSEVLKSARLTDLVVVDAPVSVATMQQISEKPNLRTLRLAGTSLDDVTFASYGVEQLEFLDVADTKLTSNSAGPIASIRNPRQLCMNVELLTEQVLQAMQGWSSLKVLELRHGEISAAMVTAMGQLPSLEELRLIDCSIVNVPASDLVNSLVRLSSLAATETSLDPKVVLELARNNRTLKFELDATTELGALYGSLASAGRMIDTDIGDLIMSELSASRMPKSMRQYMDESLVPPGVNVDRRRYQTAVTGEIR